MARSSSAFLAILGLALLASACATPVAISTASPRAIHRYLTQNALSTNEPSMFSLIELRRYDLLDAFADDPDAALARLHELALEQGLPPEALFALAELSFLRAEQVHDPGRFGASALYAWAFLFPEEQRAPLDALDPRSRVAADLYNRALASAFQREPGGAVVLREGGLPCPSGTSRRSPACLRTSAATRSSASTPWPSSWWWASAIATAGPGSARRSRRRSRPRRRARRSRFRST